MQKSKPHHLVLYRRHKAKCPLYGHPRILDGDGCDCTFWVHGRLRGKFVRHSLDTRSLVSAKLKKNDLEAGRGPDDDPPPGAPKPASEITLEYARSEFLKAKNKLKESSQVCYRRATKHFLSYAEAHSWNMLAQIDTSHLADYFSEYYGPRGWRATTAQSRLTHLRVFFNWCAKPKRRWLAYSPAEDDDLNYRKGTTKSERLPFTESEVTRILAAVEQMPLKLRDRARALVQLLLHTGMRISDATFFERKFLTDANLANYYVIKNKRWIDLPPEVQQPALDALAKLPFSRTYFFWPDRPDDYEEARAALRDGQDFSLLMPGYETRIQAATRVVLRVLSLAGLKGACHRFRDTFAVNLLVSGVDVYTVSQFLGHSDVGITQEHYLKGKLISSYRERMSKATRSLAYVFPNAA
jgi:site-specific recombinase XerD